MDLTVTCAVEERKKTQYSAGEVREERALAIILEVG